MDLMPLMEVALSCSFFTVLGCTFKQIRGVCIGDPAAPAICAATVGVDEHCWHLSFNLCVRPSMFSRYVDNRLVCLPEWALHDPRRKHLLDLDFYKPPVELECCNSDVYLGFTLQVKEGRFSYAIPPHPGQYRSPKSAGSLRLQLSGLRSRLHLIFAGTWPREQAIPSARLLVAKYQEKGFTAQDLLPILAAVRCKAEKCPLPVD